MSCSARSQTITAIGPSPPDLSRGPARPTQSPSALYEPKITETSLLPWSAISMSGMPSPLMSATVTLAGAVPTKYVSGDGANVGTPFAIDIVR